jgi:hypothetical protein
MQVVTVDAISQFELDLLHLAKSVRGHSSQLGLKLRMGKWDRSSKYLINLNVVIYYDRSIYYWASIALVAVGCYRSKPSVLVTYLVTTKLKPLFLPTPMLRLSTIATISIASLLHIASISDARSISTKKGNTNISGQTSARQASSQPKSSSLAKQSKVSSRNISASDLQSIQQLLSARYASKNQVLENVSSTSRRFYEVKSLKLTSFSDTKAQVEIEENIRGYDFRNPGYVSHQKSDLFESPDSQSTTNVFNISLEKSAGKWKINTRSK